MADLVDFDAADLLRALETRKVAAVELLDIAVARANAVNRRLNAVVATDLERARAQAARIDAQRAAGEPLGPLAGLPMTVADVFDVEGLPAAAGVAAWRARTGVRDAAAVARLRDAGAVIWGKTNTSVRAADWQTDNPLYGRTGNPWSEGRTPGGASGGAAAAVARGVTALELGADMAGSIRIPAAFCGVFAHKPTFGLVPQRGCVPPAPGAYGERDLNVVGPIARSSRDLRLALSALAAGPIAARADPDPVAGLKLGVWLDEPAFALDPEARAVLVAYADAAAKAGAQVEAVRPVDTAPLMEAFWALLLAALEPDRSRAERLGAGALRPAARLARRLGAPPGGWAGVIAARTTSHVGWLAADELRARLRASVRRVFQRCHVILAPAAPLGAFAHDARPLRRRRLPLSDGRSAPYAALMDWMALASVCGLPATVVPAGVAASGLPVGAQLIGPYGGDSRTLAVAQALEGALGGFRPPPTGGPPAPPDDPVAPRGL